MNISSLLQNNYTSQVSSSTNSQKTQKTQTTEDLLKSLSNKQDTVSISEQARAFSRTPPPQKAMDFSNMSDEDLESMLTDIQKKTGSIPGLEGSENTDVSSLTDEQLQQVREQLSNMQEQMKNMRGMGGMQGMGRMQGPPPNIQDMSDEDLKSMLTDIQEKTGSIPGLEDSENTDVSSLTEEQLQSARDALMEQMKKRMEEMSQYSAMFGAASSSGFMSTGEA